MARLDIDIRALNAKNASKDLDDVNKSTSNLEAKIKSTQDAIGGFSLMNLQLEKSLKMLKTSFDAGTISEAKFNSETKRLSLELTSVRSSIQKSQSQLSSYTATLNQTANNSRTLGTSMGNLQAYSNDFTSGIRSVNGVTLEFGRILQDLPFGMIGIGNNLQQLTTNWGYYATAAREAAKAQGQTVTTGQLVRGALTSMLSPVNLLTLGVSAVTAGWTAYTMWQQRSKKATEETTKSISGLVISMQNIGTIINAGVFKSADEITKNLSENMRSYERAQLDASKSAMDEVRSLKVLYEASQDQNRSIDERTKFVRVLKSEYPEYLKKFSNEAILAGQAKTAYDQLTTSIQNTAKARVYGDVLSENLRKEFDNQRAINKLREENVKTQEEFNKKQQQGLEGGYALGGALAKMYTDQIDNRNLQIQALEKQNKILGTDSTKLETDINDLLKDRLDIKKKLYQEDEKTGKQVIKDAETLANLLSRISSVFTPETDAGNLVSLAGLDKIQQATQNRYQKLIDNVDAIEKQGVLKNKGNQDAINKITASALSERNEIIKAKEAEISQNIINYNKETQDTINKLYEEAGVTRITSRERELRQNEVYYNKLRQQHEQNANVLTAIDEAQKVARNEINSKWDSKALDDVAKLQAKITKIEETPFKAGQGVDEVRKELDKRLKQISDFYNQIYAILTKNGLSTAGFNMNQSFEVITTSAEQATNELSRYVKSQFRRSISSSLNSLSKDVVSSFQSMYDIEEKYADLRKDASQDQIKALNKMMRLEKQINNGISNMFISLSNAFASMGGGVITGAISQGISDGDFKQLQNLFKGDNKALGYGSLGSLIGGAVSGLTPRTSKVGQGLGGLLSGAGAGAMIGSIIPGLGTAIGAVAGGLIGLVGGLFGASKAEKERKLQEQQIAEQKRTNALLERQNALAFTSAIIGQKTNQGIVSGVDRNEFGDIVFEIEGRKLKAVLDRENAANVRGL